MDNIKAIRNVLHVGTKMVRATSMTRQAFCDYRCLTMSEDEDGAEWGYLVEYTDGGKPNDHRHDGYISWSPADVFEQSYRPIVGLTFGQALDALKSGLRAARSHWLKKGMWIALTPGSSFDAIYARPGHATHMRAKEMGESVATEAITVLPRIDMRTNDGSMVLGCMLSQLDMLAEDWQIFQ